MNPWKSEMHVAYGNKEVPDVRVKIMEGDTVIYSFATDCLDYYYSRHGSSTIEDFVEFHVPVINPKDYIALVSKHYNKYVLEVQQIWRNSETGKDELIELPSRVFNCMDITYCNKDSSGDNPTTWVIKLYNSWIKGEK